MIKIGIQSGTKTKNYLKHLSKLSFNTTVDFVLELFFTNDIEPSEFEDEIFSLIRTLGYDHLHDIPEDILKDLEKIYQALLEQATLNSDREKLAYILLDAIKKRDLVLMVENKVIETLSEPIHLRADSAITFYDPSKGRDLSFNTL